MKRLVLSAILGLSLASASSLNIGVGTGYIDDKTKDVIVKIDKQINPLFSINAKIAKDYFKTGISSPTFLINKYTHMYGKIGLEKFKYKNDTKTQVFLQYNFLVNLYKNKIIPKLAFQSGTQSVNAKIGVFFNADNRLNFEYEFEKRWLYKNSYKDTTSTAIYINYSF